MGRPKKSETTTTTKKTSKKETKKTTKKSASKALSKTSIYKEDGSIMSLGEIEAKLLKKAKPTGTIEQSEIYDALSDFEIDDETINELLDFFATNGIKVLTGEEDEKETELDDLDDSDIDLDKLPEDDFYDDEDEDRFSEYIYIDHLYISVW